MFILFCILDVSKIITVHHLIEKIDHEKYISDNLKIDQGKDIDDITEYTC